MAANTTHGRRLEGFGDVGGAFHQGLDGGAHGTGAEPKGRTLDAEYRAQPAGGVQHRGGDGVQVLLALTDCLRPAALGDLVDLGRQRGAVNDGLLGVDDQVAVGQGAAPGQEDLPGGGGVRDAVAADLRDAAHRAAALHEVDGEQVVLAGQGQRGGLPGELGQLLQVRAGHRADVQALPGRAGQLQNPHAEPVPTAGRHVLHQPGGGERGQQPGDAADVDPGASGDLVGAQLGARLGQRVEYVHGPLDGTDLASGWPTGARHSKVPYNIWT